MLTKFMTLSALLLALASFGCNEHMSESVLPEPGPLGTELHTFDPPGDPAEASETYEIAEPTETVTLQEALALALMHNPQLRGFSWEVRAAEARQLQAALGPNPRIEVEVEEVAGSGDRSGFDGAETTIMLSQPIELGGKRARRKELAELQKELAGWDYQANRLDVFTETTKSFAGVLAAQQKVELAEEFVGLSRKVLSTVEQRVQAGKDSPVEQTKAQIALANAEIEFEKIKNDLEVARKRLAITWAGKSPAFDNATGELDSIRPAPTYEDLAESIQNNPDMARWAVEMDQRRAALKLAKANAVSDIRLGGGLQHFNETDEKAAVFGVQIPIPIFDRNQGTVLEARYAVAKARAQRRAVEANIHAALTQTHAELSSAFDEASGLKEKVLEGAQSAFDAANEGYRSGKLGFLVVLDAQRTLFEAKAKYIKALARYHQAKADVERLVGHPIDVVNPSDREEQE